MIEPMDAACSGEVPILPDVAVCGVEEELGVFSLPTFPVRLDDVVAELADNSVSDTAEVLGSLPVAELCRGTTVNGESSTFPTDEEACEPAAELTVEKFLVSIIHLVRCSNNAEEGR